MNTKILSMLLLILAATVTGCGDKKEEETKSTVTDQTIAETQPTKFEVNYPEPKFSAANFIATPVGREEKDDSVKYLWVVEHPDVDSNIISYRDRPIRFYVDSNKNGILDRPKYTDETEGFDEEAFCSDSFMIGDHVSVFTSEVPKEYDGCDYIWSDGSVVKYTGVDESKLQLITDNGYNYTSGCKVYAPFYVYTKNDWNECREYECGIYNVDILSQNGDAFSGGSVKLYAGDKEITADMFGAVEIKNENSVATYEFSIYYGPSDSETYNNINQDQADSILATVDSLKFTDKAGVEYTYPVISKDKFREWAESLPEGHTKDSFLMQFSK